MKLIAKTGLGKGLQGLIVVIILSVLSIFYWPYVSNWQKIGVVTPKVATTVTDGRVQKTQLEIIAMQLENMTNGQGLTNCIDVPSVAWANGYIKESRAYQVANDSIAIVDSTGMPILLPKSFANQEVFVEKIFRIPSGQVFLIVQVANAMGIKEPGHYGIPAFAISFFPTKQVADEALATIVGGNVTINFPLSIDPARFIASSGWTKRGDNVAGNPGFNGCSGYTGSNEIWCPDSGTIKYSFTLDQTPTANGVVQVTFRGSSENSPPTDIQLLVNGNNVGTQTFPADNGRGAERTWKFNVNLLTGGSNELTFMAKKNGLVLYRSKTDVIKLEYFPV